MKTEDCNSRFARRSLVYEHWPCECRALWESHTSKARSLFGADKSAEWSPATLEALRRAFMRFLGFLEQRHARRLHQPFEAASSPKIIEDFISELRKTCRDTSVASYLLRCAIVLSWLSPDHDHSLMLRASRRIGAMAPRLRHPVVSLHQIHRASLADLALGPAKGVAGARSFRDAMLVGVLCEAPMRLGSLTALQLYDLTKVDANWQIDVRPEHAKRRKGAEYELSSMMSGYLDIYLEEIRSLFGQSDSHDSLWVTSTGTPISSASIARIVQDFTKAKIGVRVSPHGFRRAAAAYIAHTDPANVLSVRDLLNHEDFRTTQRHYLPAARTRSAGRYLAGILGVSLDSKFVSYTRGTN